MVETVLVNWRDVTARNNFGWFWVPDSHLCDPGLRVKFPWLCSFSCYSLRNLIGLLLLINYDKARMQLTESLSQCCVGVDKKTVQE